jgi:RNA polymerase sigma-70 factor (ECF subfamily)
LRSTAEAEEVSQECFLALSQLEPPSGDYFGPWLHRVATNLAIKRLRSDTRRTKREAEYAQGISPITELHHDDLHQAVDAVIEELPEDLRAPLVAYYLGQMTQADIARTMNIPRQTVNNRIQRGLESARRKLHKRGITAGAGALLLLLEGASAEAAPAHLVAKLGRRAIAGVSGMKAGRVAVASTGLAGIPVKGVATATALGLATAALVAVGIALWVGWHRDSAPPPAQAQQSAAHSAETTQAPAPPASTPTEQAAPGTAAPRPTGLHPALRTPPQEPLPVGVRQIRIQGSRQ